MDAPDDHVSSESSTQSSGTSSMLSRPESTGKKLPIYIGIDYYNPRLHAA